MAIQLISSKEKKNEKMKNFIISKKKKEKNIYCVILSGLTKKNKLIF
jgi:hypothetical protein